MFRTSAQDSGAGGLSGLDVGCLLEHFGAPEDTVSLADFHARVEIWAVFEEWKDVPPDVRTALNEWETDSYERTKRPQIEALLHGREPARDVLLAANRAGLMQTGQVVEIDGRVTGAATPSATPAEGSRRLVTCSEVLCRGCGVCATGCPADAIVMDPLPAVGQPEGVQPPPGSRSPNEHRLPSGGVE